MSLGVTDRDDRPLILIDLDDLAALAIRDEAVKRNWRLVNAKVFGKIIPQGISPAGVLGHGGQQDDFTKALLNRGVPYVRVGHFPCHYWNSIPSVFAAFEDTGPLAARFFADRGFRNLAFVGSIPKSDGQMIYRGFADTTRSLGCDIHVFRMRSLKVHPELTDKKSWLLKQSELLVSWLKKLPGPVGLLAYSDRMAARLCLYCIEGGLRVPEDVAILGVGNDPFFCETAPVALSSIDLSWKTLGHEACNLLQSIMNGESPPNGPLLVAPRDVVERRSTDVLAVPDPIVAKTMQYIWDNIDTDILVDDLVAEMGVSRSILERRFKACIGRGINAELRRKRMEVAEELLRKTNLKVYAIARKVGFNSLSYFHRFFAKKHGMSPAKFRKEISNGAHGN